MYGVYLQGEPAVAATPLTDPDNGYIVTIMIEEDKMDAGSSVVLQDGLTVHYKRAGHGMVVLLLHGSGASLASFDGVAARLSASFDVLRIDLPGFGRTGPRADRDYRIEILASTVGQVMEVLGVSRYALVGHSLGGNIAWNLALDRPERIAGLVLINATGYPGKSLPAGMRLAQNPFLRPLLRRWMPRFAVARSLRLAAGSGFAVDDAMIDRVYAMANRPGNREAFVDFVNTRQRDRSAEIPRITTPTLILRSASIDGQYFAHDIPTAREEVHADGGRLLPQEDPGWVADAIERFLVSLDVAVPAGELR